MVKKEKYYYNPNSLRYEKVERSWLSYFGKAGAFLLSSILMGFILTVGFLKFFDSPKEKLLEEEIQEMEGRYLILEAQMNDLNETLDGLKERDENIYRAIFERDPIPDVAIGGVDRYKGLENYQNAELMVRISSKLDRLKGQSYRQSISYDEIVELVKNKEDMLASIPSIQPVSNEDLKRLASGFGMRIDPVYKVPKMHAGIDFSAPTGTEIYATGKGKVITANYSKGGYGNQVIIDHGYGYKTLYAHLSKFNCYEGQEVARGQVIGYVGNTGKSVGAHLHYEVIFNGQKINPVYYFYNDITNDQYEKMLEIASSAGRTLD